MSPAPHQPIDLGPITVTFSVEEQDSNGSVTVQRCDVEGGHGVPLAHSHDAFEETIYGLEGVTTFTVDGEDVAVGPGDTLCIRRGQVHSFMAHDGDVSFLAIATPGVFGPDYFHEIGAVVRAAGDGPPDMAALADVMRRHGLTPVPQPVG
ncbi:MAG TPA: cupin domain-containing protein [Solirubrobacteraceae bacterium]|jgi:quercetin dioxygenase-like cupin family protein|nr:cupin domain-containing protein [Solirubrobacteraceae bacterium]